MNSRSYTAYAISTASPVPAAARVFESIRATLSIRSRRQQAVCQRLLALGLGGGMIALLAVYNLNRDALVSSVNCLLAFFA